MAARYRLEALLTLRRREKKRAELLLAKALQALKEAKETLEKFKEELKAIRRKEKEKHHKMDEAMGQGRRIQEGCFHVNFLRKLKEDAEAKTEEIEKQKKVAEECQEKVLQARRSYFSAIRQLRMMEKHKELWAKRVRAELTRKEERAMDELGQTIHGLRKWRGERSEFQLVE